MINKNHSIEIFVDNQKIDIYSQDSLNVRINTKLFDPTTIITKQSEYSYSFRIPSTPNNNKIFNYTNILAKTNKFNTKYIGEVYADGFLIFKGTFKISSYSNNEYSCNLVSIKLNTLQDIFGESKLTDFDWYTPFEGEATINEVNNDGTNKYPFFFPLTSYGVFQKKPKTKLANYNEYTSKFLLDNTNQWYLESFPPSLKMLEVFKKCFEYKGYKVQGDIFDDDNISNIHMSLNLSDKQDPSYNVGNPKFGKLSLTAKFSNYYNSVPHNPDSTSGGYSPGTNQSLTYPYYHIDNTTTYQFDSIQVYNMLSGMMRGRGDDIEDDVVIHGDTYMYDEGEKHFVIPSDGLYKIEMGVNVKIGSWKGQMIKQIYETRRSNGTLDTYEEIIDIPMSMRDRCPIEIQLVKNYDQDAELIKGNWNRSYSLGNSYDVGATKTWDTAYPHEDLYGSNNPTKTVDGTKSGSSSRRPASTSSDDKGYMPKIGELMCYDPIINPNFICGFSSISNCPSVIKNRYSWNPLYSEKKNSAYNQGGYYNYINNGTTSSMTLTDYNKNKLNNAPNNYCNLTNGDKNMNGKLYCIVELKKNDVLSLLGLTRTYEENRRNNRSYTSAFFDATIDLTIEAFSPNSVEDMQLKNQGWTTPTIFSKDLRLSNFLNSEMKMYDFVNNVIKEFNLSYEQLGNVININKQSFNINEAKYSVNIDNRTNINDCETSKIEYPSSIEVKYKIDTEEWGFEKTIEEDKLNLPNWADFGDYGSSKIILDDNGENTSESIQLNTSYTYYDEFNKVNYNVDGSEKNREALRIPVISKFSYMIDGYDYEESMKHDGKGLPLRYWYKSNIKTNLTLTNNQKVDIKLPINSYNVINLSYKVNEDSILNNYFNITPYLSSNFVQVEVYLNPIEYKNIKNGCNIILDDDVYIVNEISGYDPTNNNKTKLLLMKKV